MDALTNYFGEVMIIQIGAGGTGGWLVPHVAKLVQNLKNFYDIKTSYLIIDDDIVEERNIRRQNFTRFDLYKSKASALALRYVAECDCIEFFKGKFSKELKRISDLQKYLSYKYCDFSISRDRRLAVFLGCVDNSKTRHAIYDQAEVLSNTGFPVIYIDSGNDLDMGQIITIWWNLPESFRGQDQTPVDFKSIYKKSHKNKKADDRSCAYFGDQTHGLNNLAASIMFINLQNILFKLELPPNYIQFFSNGLSTIKI